MTAPPIPDRWSAEIVNPQGGRSWVSAPSRRWLVERVAAQLGVSAPRFQPVASDDTPQTRLLRTLAAEREVGAGEAALALNLSKTAAHGRLLRACRRGALVRVARGRYRAAG